MFRSPLPPGNLSSFCEHEETHALSRSRCDIAKHIVGVMKFKTWEEKDYEMQDVLDARALFMFCLTGTGAKRQ